MKTLLFTGYSDDTFGEYGCTMDDVDNCASMKPIQVEVKSGQEGLVVVGQYNHPTDACWTIGISLLAEDIPLPDWSIRYSALGGYSPKLEIDVPDDAELTWYSDGRKVGEDT